MDQWSVRRGLVEIGDNVQQQLGVNKRGFKLPPRAAQLLRQLACLGYCLHRTALILLRVLVGRPHGVDPTLIGSTSKTLAGSLECTFPRELITPVVRFSPR